MNSTEIIGIIPGSSLLTSLLGFFLQKWTQKITTDIQWKKDAWLDKYTQLREIEQDFELAHIFVGTNDNEFPIEAEKKFKNYYMSLWKELYRTKRSDL